MTAPLASFTSQLAERLGLATSQPVTSALLFAALVLAPAALALSAAYVSRAVTGVSAPMRELFCRFSFSLIPLGIAMWAGHFLFHLSVGWSSGWETIRRAAADAGWPSLEWRGGGFSAPLLGLEAVQVLQTVLLDGGVLLALYLSWRVCLTYAPRGRDALRLFASWAGLATMLYAVGVWIILQPMQMRGLAGPILSP